MACTYEIHILYLDGMSHRIIFWISRHLMERPRVSRSYLKIKKKKDAGTFNRSKDILKIDSSVEHSIGTYFQKNFQIFVIGLRLGL